ncbi:MAG TPA: AAC(3) family N-acetyltransferase [Pyrinomonadaceae bacterium]|jgi:aminoglycoside N3'-acetyltransferase|nr:AAC(3) family N-acetyltransferase [Pyrinomonadaceae bacterium]
MQGYKRFKELLDDLEISRGDVVYLHTSFKRMAYLGLTGEEFLGILVERLGDDGTLVLPSFAWNLDKRERPWKGYNDYFHSRPLFDVRRTPANIGFVPELFRNWPGVRRSVNYWWSICARGARAEELTVGQERVVHPYGPGSSFDLLRIHDVKILGLGVSLNTTSLAPVPDYALGEQHSQRVFTDEPQKGAVVDHEGTTIETHSFWLLPEVVRLIKPSVLIEESAELRRSVLRADEGENINFSYPYGVYHSEALRLGAQACADGQPVPWLRNYPLKQAGEKEKL